MVQRNRRLDKRRDREDYRKGEREKIQKKGKRQKIRQKARDRRLDKTQYKRLWACSHCPVKTMIFSFCKL